MAVNLRDFFGTQDELELKRFGPPVVTKQTSGENIPDTLTEPDEVINEGNDGSGRYVPSTYAVFDAA